MHRTISKSFSFRAMRWFFCLAFCLCVMPLASLAQAATPTTHSRTHARSHRSRRARSVRAARITARHRRAAHLQRIRQSRLRQTRTRQSGTNRANSRQTYLRQAYAPASTLIAASDAQSAATAPDDPDSAIDAASSTYVARNTASAQPLVVPIPRYVPAPLRGSHDVLVHQNIIADVEGLGRIQNDAQIHEMLTERSLVALPVGATLRVDPRLPVNRRYCRPWTADFLTNLARAHEFLFYRPIQVNSAVRTVQFQEHLERVNGNAAPASGDTASPHLTGQAVDIGKKGMSRREIAWMRAYLGELQDAGKLDVEEEFQQSCFHISVYQTYEPTALPSMQPSRNLIARADVPRAVVSAYTAPRAVPHRASLRSHRAARRRRSRHVYASMVLVHP